MRVHSTRHLARGSCLPPLTFVRVVIWGVLTAFLILMQIRTIAIIAEGIPEALTRKLIKMADKKGVTIIGPATVSPDFPFLLLSIRTNLQIAFL